MRKRPGPLGIHLRYLVAGGALYPRHSGVHEGFPIPEIQVPPVFDGAVVSLTLGAALRT
ncbi:hypothetical protein D3C73_1482190 [compost metagenome]